MLFEFCDCRWQRFGNIFSQFIKIGANWFRSSVSSFFAYFNLSAGQQKILPDSHWLPGMVFCAISGTNSGFIISSLTGMIWGGFSEKNGTWAAPGTRHGKSRVDPGKTETTGWACLSRTAYRSGTSHPKNSKYFRVYSREKFTDSGGTYENRAYQKA